MRVLAHVAVHPRLGLVCVLAASALVLAACGHSAPRAAADHPLRHGRTTTTSSTALVGAGCLRSTKPEAPSASAPAAAAVQFVSPKVGWVAGAGRILTTSDGGQTWSTELTGSFVAGEVDFLNHEDGFVVTQGALLRTTDGGRCWTEVSEPSAGALRSVHFVSPSKGWGIAGGDEQGPEQSRPASTSTTDPSSAPSVAPRPPWSGGTLVETTDGGHHWATITGAPANAQSVCFVNDDDGWLGADGQVWASKDGGAKWRETADPTTASGYKNAPPDLEVVDCGAPSAVWVVSATGRTTVGNSPWAVFASSNGTTFHLIAQDQYSATFTPSLITPGSFPGVASVVSADAAAVTGYTPNREPGSQTSVQVMTADGSEIEGTHVVPEMGRPTGLAFLSRRVGWIVGTDASSTSDAGLIEHTTNGGSTWTIQTALP